MSGRVTVFLVVAVAIAGAYVLVIDRPRVEAQAARAVSERQLVPLEPDEVRAFELPLARGAGRVRVVRDEEEWRIEDPIQAPADGFAVEGVLGALLGLRSQLEVEEPPRDRAGFDLDPERRVVVTPSEGEPIEITFGGEAPLGKLRYVEVSTRPGVIHAVGRAQLGGLEPPLLQLRDKRLLAFDPKQVIEIVVRAAGRTVAELEYRDDLSREAPGDGDDRFVGEAAWQLRDPIEDQGDAALANQILQDLAAARADAILDAPGRAAEYGLEPPALELRLGTPSGGAPVLALGKVGERHYARAGGAGPVFEIGDYLLESVPRDAAAYRYKRVLALRRSQLEGVRLSLPAADRSYGLSVDAEARWLVSEGEDGDPRPIDPAGIEELLYRLEFLEASGVIEAADPVALGLDPPRARLDLLDASGSLGWLELGTPEPGRGIPARSATRVDVWLLDETLAESLPLDAEALERRLLAPPAPEADEDEASDARMDAPSNAPQDAPQGSAPAEAEPSEGAER